MTLGSRMIPLINAGLWAVYCLAFVAVYVPDWRAPQTAPFVTYVVACSLFGLALSDLSWRWGLSPWIRRKASLGWRTILAMLAAAASAALIHGVLTVNVEPLVFARRPPFLYALISNFISFYFIYCMVYILGVLTEVMRRDMDRRQRLALAENRAQQAHLMALRLQINPHFLFNALNAVTALISTQRSPEALETVHRLSRFLRTVTETSPHEFSAINDEIEMAEAYLSVESVRFQERIETRFRVAPDAFDLMVPNFILQPLFENAVKHGVGATAEPTLISLDVDMVGDRARIVVENRSRDTAAAPERPDGLGVGLSNVRERLAAIYGGAAEVESEAFEGGFRVTLTLPARMTLDAVA